MLQDIGYNVAVDETARGRVSDAFYTLCSAIEAVAFDMAATRSIYDTAWMVSELNRLRTMQRKMEEFIG